MPGGPGGGPGGAPMGLGGTSGCWLMSIVPLNLGAAAPLRLKPHFTHVDAVSAFCVPQLGQNTSQPPKAKSPLRLLVRASASAREVRGSVLAPHHEPQVKG